MSVFIHYRGKLTPNADVEPLFDFVRRYGLKNGWKTLEWEETGKTFAAKESGKDPFRPTLAPISQKGVIINIDNGKAFVPIVVEKSLQTLVMFFPGPGQAWMMTNNCFVATDTVAIDTHIAVCNLFHQIRKRFVPALEVRDEGEYFETKDRNRLEKIRRQNVGRLPDEPSLKELRDVYAQAEKLKNPFDNTNSPN